MFLYDKKATPHRVWAHGLCIMRRTSDEGLAADLLEVCAVLPGHPGGPHNLPHRQPCSHLTDEKTEAQRSELTGLWQGWVQIKGCHLPKLRFPPRLHDTGSSQRHKGLTSEVTPFPFCRSRPLGFRVP